MELQLRLDPVWVPVWVLMAHPLAHLLELALAGCSHYLIGYIYCHIRCIVSSSIIAANGGGLAFGREFEAPNFQSATKVN